MVNKLAEELKDEDGNIDESSYHNIPIEEQITNIPPGHYYVSRYDTDKSHVLNFTSVDDTTYDIYIKKEQKDTQASEELINKT